MKKRVAIIGSGPAGYAAALYTSRADLQTTIFAGNDPGGQLMKTTEIENFPGTMKGTVGPVLMSQMQEQATRFGGEIVFESVGEIQRQESHISLKTESKEYEFDAVIVTTGASPRMLGIGEEKYWGKGLSTCAVCDGAFYRNKIAYVVGGGDSAIEDATALTKYASEVHLLVRGDKMRASKAMQKRLDDAPIKVHYNTSVVEVRGVGKIEELVLSNEEIVKTDGLFLAIGHTPVTKFLEGSGVVVDEHGYIKTGLTYPVAQESSLWLTSYPTMTAVDGVFAAGDCVDFRYRQAAVASGMGVMAALDCEKWLATKEL